LASSKAVIYSAADIVTGSAFVGSRATVSELGNTTANQLTASQGAKVVDNLPLYFGTDQDSHIRYDEGGQDFLTISGSSAGTVMSGSIVRVVDKLSIGADMTSTKASGILMVNAAADDTTNGLIATFKSGDSDYCRVNIDNTTANGDTQFTFMSNGSSKWSVGNMGSNETLHIKSGFGDFADGDPFVLTTTALTLNTSLTASSGGLIPDDKRLYFGDSGDGHITYREDGGEFLTISGTHPGGIALSGSKLMIDVQGLPNLVASGSRGGPGSYLALSSTGQVVMSTPDGGGAISSVGNGADNRIATFSDSDALNGEANLTFNGSTLTLAGVMTGSSYSGFRVATTEAAFTNSNIGAATGSSLSAFGVSAGQVNGAFGSFTTVSASAATLHNITLNNVAISADAGEINLLDGSGAGTLASSKAVIYSSADIVTGSAFVGFGVSATQANIGIATGSLLAAHRLASTEVTVATLSGSSASVAILSGSSTTLHNLTVGGVATALEIENGSSAGTSALLIDNDDIDQIALEIEPANTTANVFEVTGSALTTGGAIKVYSNSSDNSARSLVKIVNDNSSATKAVGLTINQWGAAPSAVLRGSMVYNVYTHTGLNMFVTGQTISASFLAGGQYNCMNRNSGQSDTTDTATAIQAAMGDVATSDFAEFVYMNMSSNSVTLAGGTNVIMANMQTASYAIGAGTGRRFLVSCFSIHPDSPKVQMVPTSAGFNINS